jgi:Zn ribbon nucleic-acid-binding protein
MQCGIVKSIGVWVKNKMKSTEIIPCTYDQLVFNEYVKQFKRKESSSVFTNDAETFGYPQSNKRNCYHVL